jgi:signal transduction histidine kinase
VQEGDQYIQRGFLMLLPVYEYVDDVENNQQLQGFVYSAFRMNDFIYGTLDVSLFEYVQISIHNNVPDNENIFFKSDEIKDIVGKKFSSTKVIEFGGKTWVVDFNGYFPDTTFVEGFHMIVPFLGYPMSILLFYTILLISKNVRLSKNMAKKEKVELVGEISSRFAHDVRNPLSNIKMSIDLLKADKKFNPDVSIQEKFQIISKNVDRISHQVDDVLGFVRSHPIEKKPGSLKSCFSEVMEDIETPKNIRIILPKNNVSVAGDFFQLQIVFKNLINNAIESIGNQEGHIIIRLRDESKHVMVEIEDSGPGFPDIGLETIFEPLTTTKQTGTGLGLVSCKQIIQSHGGSISVKTDPTIFMITLPKI